MTAAAKPLWRRVLAAVEPWYNWGTINIERFDTLKPDEWCDEGEARFFDLQWFGLHVGIQFGRLPRKGER